MDKLNMLIFQLSEHADTAASKFISYFGYAGVGGGAAIWATEKGRPAVEVVQQGLTIADWAGIVSIVAGVTLVLQRIVDSYYTSRADKRKEIELKIKIAEAEAEGLKVQLKQESDNGDDHTK